jgi:hypothetical protein
LVRQEYNLQFPTHTKNSVTLKWSTSYTKTNDEIVFWSLRHLKLPLHPLIKIIPDVSVSLEHQANRKEQRKREEKRLVDDARGKVLIVLGEG